MGGMGWGTGEYIRCLSSEMVMFLSSFHDRYMQEHAAEAHNHVKPACSVVACRIVKWHILTETRLTNRATAKRRAV